MLDQNEREIVELTIQILMKQQIHPADNATMDHFKNCHEAAEALRKVLDPTYVGIF
jgi:hypothetical protein